MVGGLAADGLAASTRRGYVQAFKGFHRFLESRKAVEIDALFGVRLVCPVDEFNAARHVGDDSPAVLPPPTPERVDGVLRVPEGPDRHGTEVRAGGPGLRVVPDAVSRRAAGRGVRAAGAGGCAFRPWPVRQAARSVRQGRTHLRAAAAVGADARRAGPGAALVRAGCAGPVPGLGGVVPRRVRSGAAPRHDPQPAAVSDGAGGPPGRGPVQPACAAPGLRHPQLRAGRGSRCHPTASRALDGELDDAVCAAVGHVHRGRLPAGGDRDRQRAHRGGSAA